MVNSLPTLKDSITPKIVPLVFGFAFVLYLFLNLNGPLWMYYLSVVGLSPTEEGFGLAKGVTTSLCFALLLAPTATELARTSVPNRWALRSVGIAILVFAALCWLSFPYTFPLNPLARANGLSSIGAYYGEMSRSPFLAEHEFVFRRLFAPWAAFLLFLRGDRYFLFSLLSSAAFCLSAIFALESQLAQKKVKLPPAIRILGYVSFLTGSYMMHSLQSPGYPETLGFALLAALLFVPLSPLARLALIPIFLSIHDGLAFPLAAAIVVLFPRRERLRALALIALYFVLFAAIQAPALGNALAGHHIVGPYSHRAAWAEIPGIGMAGIFLAFKLFWIPLLWFAGRDLKSKRGSERFALPILVAGGLVLLLLAWDVSRLTGFAFLAGLLALARILTAYPRLSTRWRWVIVGFFVVNLLIPSYPIELNLWVRPGAGLKYPFPGLYHWLHLTFVSPF